MSTLKPDNGLLFIKMVCYTSMLYTISMAWQSFNFYIENLNPRSIMSESEPEILKILFSFVYSYWGTTMFFIVSIINLIAAILTLIRLNNGRILLIITFYLLAGFSVLTWLSNINIIYHAYKASKGYVKIALGIFQFLRYFAPAILLLWIVKQLKSEVIKTLFHKKSVPEITGTL